MVAGGALRWLPAATGALGGAPPGLLSPERCRDPAARLALEQVERLAGALAAPPRGSSAPPAEAAQVSLVEGCLALINVLVTLSIFCLFATLSCLHAVICVILKGATNRQCKSMPFMNILTSGGSQIQPQARP